MQEHRAQVVKNLTTHSAPGSVRDNYVWVARYHNYITHERLGSEPKFLIESELEAAERQVTRGVRPVYP